MPQERAVCLEATLDLMGEQYVRSLRHLKVFYGYQCSIEVS